MTDQITPSPLPIAPLPYFTEDSAETWRSVVRVVCFIGIFEASTRIAQSITIFAIDLTEGLETWGYNALYTAWALADAAIFLALGIALLVGCIGCLKFHAGWRWWLVRVEAIAPITLVGSLILESVMTVSDDWWFETTEMGAVYHLVTRGSDYITNALFSVFALFLLTRDPVRRLFSSAPSSLETSGVYQW